MEQQHDQHHTPGMVMSRSSYWMLAANLAASAVVMYFVMYTMIYSIEELFNNLNNVYMTAMMVSSMAMLMLWMMGSMFDDRRLNIILYILFAAMFLLALAGMRTQALVGDRQFLRAMIPHHSGAVLMCRRSSIRDPQIVALCRGIIASQTQEISRMKAILARQ